MIPPAFDHCAEKPAIEVGIQDVGFALVPDGPSDGVVHKGMNHGIVKDGCPVRLAILSVRGGKVISEFRHTQRIGKTFSEKPGRGTEILNGFRIGMLPCGQA